MHFHLPFSEQRWRWRHSTYWSWWCHTCFYFLGWKSEVSLGLGWLVMACKHFYTCEVKLAKNPLTLLPRDRGNKQSVEVKLVNMLQWRQVLIKVLGGCHSSPFSLSLTLLDFPLLQVGLLFWRKPIIRCIMFPEMKSELGVVSICAVNIFRQCSHTMNEGVSSRYVFVFLLNSISNSHSLILLTGPRSPAETCVWFAAEQMGTVCGTRLKSDCVCLTGSTVNPYMSKGSYCSGKRWGGGGGMHCTCHCVFHVRVSVSPHHSLLIRYGDVSMLQDCMIKRSGLNVKPYRDQRKQSRKLSWQAARVVCVCEHLRSKPGWNALWMLWPFTKPGLSAVLITRREVWFLGLARRVCGLDTRLCSLRCPWTSSQRGFPQHVVSDVCELMRG